MAQMPDPFPSLLARIKRIEDRLNQRLASSPFFGTPIRPQADGSVQSDDFDGDLANDDAGTKGWALSSLKAAFGELILRPGSVGNDALTDPVVPGVANLTATNFGLGSGPYVEVAGLDLTVPDGCTRLLFNGTGMVDCYNPKTTGGNNGTGGDYLYCRVKVGSVDSGHTQSVGVSGNGGNATVTDMFAQNLSGLTPGGTVRVSVLSVSDYGIAVNAGNLAILSASLVWLR